MYGQDCLFPGIALFRKPGDDRVEFAVRLESKVVAGLPCGKEGPMIHSGAIVGAMATPLVG